MAHYRRLNWCRDAQFGRLSHPSSLTLLPSPFVPLPKGEGMLWLPLPLGEGWGEGNVPPQRERECCGSLSLWERAGVREIRAPTQENPCPHPRKSAPLPKKIRAPTQENPCPYPSVFLPKKTRVPTQENPCSRPRKFAGIWQFPTLRGAFLPSLVLFRINRVKSKHAIAACLSCQQVPLRLEFANPPGLKNAELRSSRPFRCQVRVSRAVFADSGGAGEIVRRVDFLWWFDLIPVISG